MDSFILKRGNTTIQLEKSEDQIALRPEKTTDLAAAMPALGGDMEWSDTNKKLGGFHLINIKGAENIDRTLDQLREHELIATGSHVYHTPQSQVPYVPTGKLTLRFTPGTSDTVKQAILDAYKLMVVASRVKENPAGGKQETFIVAVTPDSMNPLKVAYELQHHDNILLAEPDLSTPGKLAQFALPGDPLFKEQWHLQNSGVQFGSSLGLKAGADARVVEAWQKMQSLGSPDCIIAVIDDGFDLTHPDLGGNGKIVAPWDFQTQSPDPSPRKKTPFDGDYHGTACAGLALGNSNNEGITGVAPSCRLMPIRWNENINDDNIEAWFNYAAQNGAWVINCSWGASPAYYVLSTRQLEVIEDCARNGRNGLGCVIIFAAGNANTNINDPAHESVNGFAIHPDVIAVAASTSRDERAGYSNYGREISVCAPTDGQGGRGLLTTDVRGTFTFQGIEYAAGYDAGDYTKIFGGTSGAAPVVAGVCALMLSHNPRLKAADVKQILQLSSRRIGNAADYTNGHSEYYGYGCVNAAAAIDITSNHPYT
ncbi:S8 family peptidase [Chitinophaga varians]|uniref:S8 family peptidase n=1 Tax=Chitinophaga varians TaxID=2202339 RepID=UPI00165F1974|nr:S8 family serine peptidase [Chitinophaga varians]MBC9909753.1 S8 family serine peptidase [Chitinophaga varians]